MTATDALPSVTVDKSSDGTVVEGGEDQVYTIKITNGSLVEAVTVTALTDDKFGDLLAEAEAANGGPIVLGVGESFSFDVTRSIELNAGASHTNVVTVTVADDEGNTAQDDDDDTVTATDALPSITVDKSSDGEVALGGEDQIYTIKITNTSTAEAVSVTSISDDRFGDLLAEAEAANGGPIEIAAGGSFSFEINRFLDLAPTETYVNVVTVVAEDDEGNSTTESDDDAVTVPPTPGIAIDKVTVDEFGNTGDGIAVLEGDVCDPTEVSWLYTVTNTGNVALDNVVVTDSDAGLVVEAVDADEDGFNDGDLNKDGLLDTTETWTFAASGTAIDFGDCKDIAKYENTGVVEASYGEIIVTDSDDSSYYLIEAGYITDSSLCDAGKSFELNFTPDKGDACDPEYKLSSSNPGQFYYNLFFDAAELQETDGKLTVSIPFPFVLQGANPIHAYSSVTVDDETCKFCFNPGDEWDGVTISYETSEVCGDGYSAPTGGEVGSYADHYEIVISLDGLPESGLVYLNMHLDYGLEGTGGWEQQQEREWSEDAIGGPDGVDIYDHSEHKFYSSIEGSWDAIYNDNVFHGPKWTKGCDDDDDMHGGKDGDHMHGKGGHDHMRGDKGHDWMKGGHGDDKMKGDGGHDRMEGDKGHDRMHGGKGNDWIKGGKGDDKMWGDRGEDTFVFGDHDGSDKICDFNAKGDKHDRIDLSDVTDITGWKDLKANHCDDGDGGVWIHGEEVDVFVQGVQLCDLNREHFIF